jgi:nucleotidyltransferase/DNA polymerase involved in DNA repair
MSVVCTLVPRFRLLAAVGEQRASMERVAPERSALASRPAALAPEPGAAQLIGEVSEPAEALGLRPGMRVGEALSRCPELALVPADPERADLDWERVLSGLEGIGAEVESERAGEAFFEATGLHNLWRDTAGVLARAHREVGSPARLAAAPGRFCAYVAARRAPIGARAPIVARGSAREFLAPLPVSLLCGRLRPPGAGTARADDDAEADDLPNQLERLGIDTLGRLAGLPRDAVADRFGRLGLRALRLARGGDWPLRPRRVREGLAVEMELPDAVSGPQLERALELLIARLLAHRERRGRRVRALRLSARLAAGGGWRRQVALRRAGTERDRLAASLLPQLALLPGPAVSLRLEAVALGSAFGEQLTLADPEEQRRHRISEAVHQARAAGGSEAVLRVLEVDPDSRVPERRDVLMPWVEGAPQAKPRSNPFGEEEA